MDFGKDDLCAGGPDIDPDAGQRHMILNPQWVFFNPPVTFEIVVIVVRCLVMPVVRIVAKLMIGETIDFRFRLVGYIGHLPNCRNRRLALEMIGILA